MPSKLNQTKLYDAAQGDLPGWMKIYAGKYAGDIFYDCREPGSGQDVPVPKHKSILDITGLIPFKSQGDQLTARRVIKKA